MEPTQPMIPINANDACPICKCSKALYSRITSSSDLVVNDLVIICDRCPFKISRFSMCFNIDDIHCYLQKNGYWLIQNSNRKATRYGRTIAEGVDDSMFDLSNIDAVVETF